MIGPNALAGIWLLALAVASILHRTKRLPRTVVNKIDMLSLMLGVLVVTSTGMASWQWFAPLPEDPLSWNAAAYLACAFLSQVVGLRLTRLAMGLPAKMRADSDA
jgi:hypothetical protein